MDPIEKAKLLNRPTPSWNPTNSSGIKSGSTSLDAGKGGVFKHLKQGFKGFGTIAMGAISPRSATPAANAASREVDHLVNDEGEASAQAAKPNANILATPSIVSRINSGAFLQGDNTDASGGSRDADSEKVEMLRLRSWSEHITGGYDRETD